VQRRPHRLPQALEVEGEQAHRAGHVARIVAQALGFLQVHEQELVETELRGEADVLGRLVRRHLVEIAGQAVLPAVFVLRHLVRAEQRPDLGVEVESVDHLQSELSFHRFSILHRAARGRPGKFQGFMEARHS